MTALVSVVVLAWNNADIIDACLDAISCLDWPELEVIVVDNGSTDSTAERLRLRQGVRVVSLARNRGFAGGQVAADPHVHGEFVALVNSDAVVSPAWLSELMAATESADIAVAGGRAYDWDGTSEGLAVRDGFYSYQVIDPVSGGAETVRCGDVPVDVNSISGAAVLIRTSALRAAGGFDGRFFCYYEETDLFARMRRAGWRIRYVPTAEVWHQVRGSSKKAPDFYEYYMLRNRALFALKNFDRPFLLPFLVRYISDVRWRLRSRDRGRRLALRALFGLMLLVPHIVWQRQRIPKRSSYNAGLVKEASPVVTVAITCYNHERFVAEAIASALEQRAGVHEVVVVDDGSTDGSWDQISAFGERVRAVRTANGGVVAARNACLAMCQSEWLLFLDSDDRIPPDYVDALLRLARLHALDVAYGDSRYFGTRTDPLPGASFDPYRLLEINFIHSSALMRRDRVASVGGYRQEMASGYEDWELYLSLLESGARFEHVPGVELCYRQHAQTSSRNASAARTDRELRDTVKTLHPALYGKPPHWRLKSSLPWRVLRALLGPAKRRFKAAGLR